MEDYSVQASRIRCSTNLDEIGMTKRHMSLDIPPKFLVCTVALIRGHRHTGFSVVYFGRMHSPTNHDTRISVQPNFALQAQRDPEGSMGVVVYVTLLVVVEPIITMSREAVLEAAA